MEDIDRQYSEGGIANDIDPSNNSNNENNEFWDLNTYIFVLWIANSWQLVKILLKETDLKVKINQYRQ